MNAIIKPLVTVASARRDSIKRMLATIPSDIRYVYQYNTKSKKPTTIAYTFDDKNQVVVFNAAKCSKKDVFSRVEGRLTAAGRLRLNRAKHPNGTVPYADVSSEGRPRYRLIAEHLLTLFEGL